MANELRVRALAVGGLVEDAPLLIGATTLTSAGLAALPLVDTTNHAAIVLDPDGIDGAPEIIWVTAHAIGGTTATIARGKEGTTARQHTQDIPWVHTMTPWDFGSPSNGICGGLLAITSYAGSYGPLSSASLVDIDATNLKVTFTAPPSGRVLVNITVFGGPQTAGQVWTLGLRDGSGQVSGSSTYSVTNFNNASLSTTAKFFVSGLTAGTSYTWKAAWLVASGTMAIFNSAPVTMEVWSA